MAGNRSAEVKAAGPLYMCHGAKHSFTLKAVDDSPWINQQFTSVKSPDQPFPVTILPAVNTPQTLEDQAGVTWTFDCPRKPAEAPIQTFELFFWLRSEFTAPYYKFAASVSLGHHRLEFVDPSGDEQFQVIELAEITTLAAREISYYTREAMPFEVQWKLNNENIGPAKPGVDGRVSLDFKKNTAGTYPVRVVAPSLYYESGITEHVYNVKCLAVTPWGNDVVLQVNNKTEPDVLERGVVCTRGIKLPLKLLNENLLLQGSTVSLISADAKALGLTFKPDLNDECSMEGAELAWELDSAVNAKSGLFKLQVHCSKLKRDWEIIGHLLSADLKDEVAKVEVGGFEISDFGAVFFRNEKRELTVTFNESMRGLSVSLEEAGNPGMTYKPELNAPQKVPDSLQLKWEVTGGNVSSVFSLKVVCADVATTLTIPSRVLSKITTDEIQSITINEQPVDLARPELIFFRAGVYEVELIPKPGSSLIGLDVALKKGSGAELGMTYKPELGEAKPLPSGGFKWTVTGGRTQSGLFELLIDFPQVEQSLPLACRLLSTNLADEATVMLDGVEMPLTGVDIPSGGTMTLTLGYKIPSLLPGLGLNLDAVPDAGLSPGDLISKPPFREPISNHEWEITGAEGKRGAFKLKVFTEAETAVLVTPTIRLIRSIDFRFESFGGNPLLLPPEKNLTDTSTAFSYRVALATLDGQALIGVPVTFYVPGTSEDVYETTTDRRGLAFNLSLYENVGVHTISAVAKLEDVDRKLEILVDVVSA